MALAPKYRMEVLLGNGLPSAAAAQQAAPQLAELHAAVGLARLDAAASGACPPADTEPPGGYPPSAQRLRFLPRCKHGAVNPR
jgi:hypothetical protein